MLLLLLQPSLLPVRPERPWRVIGDVMQAAQAGAKTDVQIYTSHVT
eukprot:SAG22_NODE_392_length_11210_cov_3.879669_6_plen_46_part_00